MTTKVSSVCIKEYCLSWVGVGGGVGGSDGRWDCQSAPSPSMAGDLVERELNQEMSYFWSQDWCMLFGPLSLEDQSDRLWGRVDNYDSSVDQF